MSSFSKLHKKCCCAIKTLSLLAIVFILIFYSVFDIHLSFYPPGVYFLTEEQHIDRISNIIKEKYKKQLESGEIVNYKISLLYGFNNDLPTHFIVEFENKNNMTGSYEKEVYPTFDDYTIEYSTKYWHVIGIIAFDNYFKTRWLDIAYTFYGQSEYSQTNNFDQKKYYSPHGRAVKIDDQMILLSRGAHCQHRYVPLSLGSLDFCQDCYGKILTKEDCDSFAIKYCVFKLIPFEHDDWRLEVITEY